MARRSTRQLWAAYVAGRPPAPAVSVLETAVRPEFRGRVLGLDPSLRGTGWAVVEFPGRRGAPRLVASGTVRLKRAVVFAECLAAIHRAVTAAVAAHRPDAAAAEETIYVQNLRTAQVLGAARGAAVAAAAVAGLTVHEYAPTRVKQAVVGRGAASKEQVARTVAALVPGAGVLEPDEADATAVALCHAFTYRPE